VNVRDLHDRTAEILRQVEEDAPIFVTRYGKPIVVIQGLAKEDLEGFAMLTDPKLRRGLEQARDDVAARRVSGLDESTADYRSLRVAAEIAP
jgi:prevent-host-death family protein